MKEIYEKYKGCLVEDLDSGCTGIVCGYDNEDLIIGSNNNDYVMWEKESMGKDDVVLDMSYSRYRYVGERYIKILSKSKKDKLVIHTVDGGQKPVKSTTHSAGVDMFAREIIKVNEGYYKVKLGIWSEMPDDRYVSIVPRSSISDLGWVLCNSPGTIDADFTGEKNEWQARFRSVSDMPFPYKVGDRVAQFIVRKKDNIVIEGIEEKDVVRTSGHGHTGKN
jgi:dUTPase